MPPARTRQSASLTLEDAISLLQQAGFTVAPPELETIAAQHSDAPEALGFVSAQQKPVRESVSTITLTFQHSVNGRVFGPGKVQVKSKKLLHHLLSQDARATAQENSVFDPTPKSYLIVQRRTAGGVTGPAAVALQGFELSQIENVPVYGEYSAADR